MGSTLHLHALHNVACGLTSDRWPMHGPIWGVRAPHGRPGKEADLCNAPRPKNGSQEKDELKQGTCGISNAGQPARQTSMAPGRWEQGARLLYYSSNRVVGCSCQYVMTAGNLQLVGGGGVDIQYNTGKLLHADIGFKTVSEAAVFCAAHALHSWRG
jgi:hypothetical protein